MDMEVTPPDGCEAIGLEMEIRRLLEHLQAGGEQAKKIVRQHPGLAAAAAFLTGVWLGSKLSR